MSESLSAFLVSMLIANSSYYNMKLNKPSIKHSIKHNRKKKKKAKANWININAQLGYSLNKLNIFQNPIKPK